MDGTGGRPAPISDVQAAVLDYIDASVREDWRGLSCTYRDVSADLGLSVANAHRHVLQLRHHGCVEGELYTPRSLRLTDLGRLTLAAYLMARKPDDARLQAGDMMTHARRHGG